MRTKSEQSFQTLSGPEIETLADYLGQGAVGVKYSDGPCKKDTLFHPIPRAYDNTIASSGELCMTTDSNRSEERRHFPMRTCIEFRSGPTLEMTQELLCLVESYAIWIEAQKKTIRETLYENYLTPKRSELKPHDIPLSSFIEYYNRLPTTKNQLTLTLPHAAFDQSPDFTYDFPRSSEWVIRFEYADLDKKYSPVFFAQYNLSIPIGYVFDPEIREIFPLQENFSLLYLEKEIAADFNESRPHHALRAYEKNLFLTALALADRFFTEIHAPDDALGMRDFLRGMAFEIAHISTSETYLNQLFRNEALWIWRMQNRTSQAPDEKSLKDIVTHLSSTLRKSLFSYFLKTTLANFFKYLHPYEQHLLRKIPKDQIYDFFSEAVGLSNGGQGREAEQASYFTLDNQRMSQKFEEFYKETFLGNTPRGTTQTDPMGWLTERFIEPINISSDSSIYAVVLEVRQPEQGDQKSAAMRGLCENYSTQYHLFLNKVIPVLKKARQQLDRYHQPRAKTEAVLSTGLLCQALQQKKMTQRQSTIKRQREMQKNIKSIKSAKIYQKSDLWASAKSYREDKMTLRSGHQRRNPCAF